MTTSVPGITFGPRGFVVPADADILAGVIADINAAFGGGLNPALETPQGQLASSEAAIISAADQTFAYMAQQMDPAFNSGRFQDAIGRIYFITRDPALPTTVACACLGATGTIIPTGALAQDVSGGLYICTTGGTIPAGGSITLNFANTVTGPIACPAGTLTLIYQTVPGWDSITNPSDGVLGQDVESRQAFEVRRADSVAGNARGTIQAIQGAVLSVAGVLDSICIQNDTAGSVTIRGATLGPHSIYCAVSGGADAAVAQAIWSKKSPGCAYNGNTTVVVYDTSPYYTAPFPAYNVTFERPPALPIYFSVVMANNPGVPANAAVLVQNAIVAAFAGADGGARARIGSTIFASRFYAPIIALGAWAQILDIQIGSKKVFAGVVTGSITGTLLTVTAVASGALAPNQFLTGLGILDGIYILNQASGTTGGIGTYNLNAASPVGSITISSIAASLNSIVVNINEVPVTSPAETLLLLV